MNWAPGIAIVIGMVAIGLEAPILGVALLAFAVWTWRRS